MITKVGVYRKQSNKRQHRWIVRWYGTDSKRYGKVFKTRKEAERYASELQKRVSLGKANKPRKITLAGFICEHAKVMKGQVAPATLRDQLRALRFFEKFIGGSIILCNIRPGHAEAFIAKRLASGIEVATVNKDIRTLRRAFNLAIEPRDYLAEGQNPFARIKERKKASRTIRYVTVKEYKALIDATYGIWWQALLSVAYGSGLRRGEIINLTWSDIDFENQLIQVVPKKANKNMLEWEPKDHEKRIVPLSDQTVRFLVNLQVQSPEGHPYIFVSPSRLKQILQNRKTGKWEPGLQILNNVTRHFNKIRCKAGVKKCTLHDLRRSAITNWAEKLPIHVVQQLAGHSDIATTRKYYLSVRPEDLAAANRLLNRILAEVK